MFDLDLMDVEAVQRVRTPLKKQYREMPNTTLITLKAQGRLGEGTSCKAEASLYPATGGMGIAICSGGMFLEALVASAGITLSAVAVSIGVDLQDATIRAEGDLDFRETLGVSKDVAGGFQRVRLYFDLDTEVPEEQVRTLLHLTERYCVILQTFRKLPEITTTVTKSRN
jgi:uncharacterized OsmC-like protein